MELVFERNKLMETEESRQNGKNFIPKTSDIFIATYPKCGTTWVTQIVHGLRSKGDVDFNEITERVPWDVLALDCGQDLEADQKFHPRMFKSHLSFSDIGKTKDPKEYPKYIHVARNPLDALVSFYNFMPLYMGVTLENISIKDFCEAIFAGVSHSGTICKFYVDWFKALNSFPDNVLWIFFEDLKVDLPGSIKKIAKWLNLNEDDEEVLKIVEEQSSFEFMKNNVSKFDDGFVFSKRKHAMGMGHLEEPMVAKVREGEVGAKKTVPDDVKKMIETDWNLTINKPLGFENYEALKTAVNALQAEKLGF